MYQTNEVVRIRCASCRKPFNTRLTDEGEDLELHCYECSNILGFSHSTTGDCKHCGCSLDATYEPETGYCSARCANECVGAGCKRCQRYASR